jgi:cytochrome c553
MNIKDPEATRKLGWRKLVRLRSRPDSQAEKHNIAAGIILFNIATDPGSVPFAPADESKNSQVMLITEGSSVPAPNAPGPATLYWLDYKALSQGGTLSLALDQTFDANELPPAKNGTRSYFVPDGCVACHGINGQRALVNYLDTDHWFDRLENDFPALKASGLPLLFDAQTNDTGTLSFKLAFDVIRRFNIEADAAVKRAQPKHDEALASQKWLQVHASSDDHVAPTDRAIGLEPRWSPQNANDVKVLGALNQYCFRCHGTIKFSVFNRQEIRQPQFQALIDQAIKTNTPVGLRMPPDRDLPDDIRTLLHDFTQ